jgi:type III secretion system FlhB-like substrate exporter
MATLPLETEFVSLFDAMYEAVQGKIVTEYNQGRITDNNYAGVLASALRDVINSSVSATLQNVAQSIDNGIKEANHSKQLRMLEAQASMLEVDALNKETIVALDISAKTKQVAQVQADIDFNIAKKLIMESTRKDNVRMQAAREFAELLKYISAAGAVPAETDFTNIRALITGIIDGVTTPDTQPVITNPTAGNSWVKVV